MDFTSRMTGEAGIIDAESEGVEILRNKSRSGLLTVHAKCECLNTTKEEEGVNWCEAVSNRINGECDLLI
jgi:hypothetical protein